MPAHEAGVVAGSKHRSASAQRWATTSKRIEAQDPVAVVGIGQRDKESRILSTDRGASPERRIGSMQNTPNAYQMLQRATLIASPCTPPAASLQRNAITSATSRGSRSRF
jgi:hypothetical protein